MHTLIVKDLEAVVPHVVGRVNRKMRRLVATVGLRLMIPSYFESGIVASMSGIYKDSTPGDTIP